jgi:hypothetical protein
LRTVCVGVAMFAASVDGVVGGGLDDTGESVAQEHRAVG